jgi:hypothetical protein
MKHWDMQRSCLQISAAHAETAVYAGIARNDGTGSNQGESTPI